MATITFGDTTHEPTAVYWDAYWAFEYNVPSSGSIISITADVTAVGRYHVGVYKDNGSDYPGQLLVETGDWTFAGTGQQTKTVASTPFTAGKLWIVVSGQQAAYGTIAGHIGTQDKCLKGIRYNANYAYVALPSVFPSGGITHLDDMSLYVTVETGVQPPQGGTTNPSPASYQYDQNTVVQVQASPNSGYALVSWTLDGVNKGNALTINVTMDTDHNLVATFQTSGERYFYG